MNKNTMIPDKKIYNLKHPLNLPKGKFEMSEDIKSLLKESPKVTEAFILSSEIKICLKCSNDYTPSIKVRIYKNTISEKEPYTYEVSHYVKTPLQLGPYYSELINRETESAAVEKAIEDVVSYINGAIDAGHEPSNDWLIPNENW
ncbi:MAG: hypothetical protein PX483_03945 [Nostocales cyanobacterium LE14-WE4]|jgi:hypothetical protein|uniref:Uncharacterized protein n=1 Tax=Aphanizomenon flos-aquae WA102 TaxID=1710896 RepID=A0A1B7X074_APHFL|nr:hypothetical protein [Anabaena sp. 49633_E8]MCE2701787.1 hypothetical protein [Anabaena sp. 49633_E8]MDJ0500002.1 hypothetical protein [Nostocales cyanobacterium LE14-WE4]OBQ42754.1 MAG: hypothetical protein AN484_15975 [Aphanizomenon flos-aquae WA102]